MNAEKYGLDRIYFGGFFIRGGSSSLYLSHCAMLIPFQDMQRRWLHYHMLYGSGARERSERCFSDMRDSCKLIDAIEYEEIT